MLISRYLQKGLTLIELIAFIVIISVITIPVIHVFSTANRHLASPVIKSQLRLNAESILLEVSNRPFNRISSHAFHDENYQGKERNYGIDDADFNTEVIVEWIGDSFAIPNEKAKLIILTLVSKVDNETITVSKIRFDYE